MKVDWQKVEIRTVENNTTSNNLTIQGEAFLKNGIKSVADLTKNQEKERKKKVAKYQCMFVYVDIKRKYYFWANEK